MAKRKGTRMDAEEISTTFTIDDAEDTGAEDTGALTVDDEPTMTGDQAAEAEAEAVAEDVPEASTPGFVPTGSYCATCNSLTRPVRAVCPVCKSDTEPVRIKRVEDPSHPDYNATFGRVVYREDGTPILNEI